MAKEKTKRDQLENELQRIARSLGELVALMEFHLEKVNGIPPGTLKAKDLIKQTKKGGK